MNNAKFFFHFSPSKSPALFEFRARYYPLGDNLFLLTTMLLKLLVLSLLAAVGVRLLAPALHSRLGYTAVDPQAGTVTLADHARELTPIRGMVRHIYITHI